MMTRKKKGALLVMVLGILGMVCLGTTHGLAATPQGVLKEAIHWSISADWLDPSTAHPSPLGWFILQFFHDALLKPMPEGFYTPCLAESYTVSPDSKVYEFKLRRGVKFHNGDPMTAEDVVFTYWRYKGREAKVIHDRTEKVEAVNPFQVRIQFKKPFPDFLDCFLQGATTLGWIVPKKHVEKVGDAAYKQNPVGAGPYKFAEFVPGVRISGEAFEDYWRKVPNIKRMEFLTIPDQTTRVAMVKRGEADIATLITDVVYQEVKKDPKLRVLTPLSPVKFFIYMASQWDPKSPWSDTRVRKAASLAIDREMLAQIHMPGCKPVGSIGLDGDPFVVNTPIDPYDPERAKKLLAEAGFPKGFHGGKFYPNELYWGYSEQVANYWRAIGITVEMIKLNRAAWFAIRDGGKMKEDVFMDTAVASTIGGRLTYLFGPTSYGNYPDIQALWDQYQTEYRVNARKDLIARVQNLISEKTMWIPLTEVNSPTAVGLRVKGNPYRIQPLIWTTAPYEDMELQ
jgi:peptide/nickel transport system substrate-binding protein